MTKKEFTDFVSESKKLKNVEKLKYTVSTEFSNVVLLSGEIIGEDTLDKIRAIGEKRGIQTLTDGLSVIYYNPKPNFSIK